MGAREFANDAAGAPGSISPAAQGRGETIKEEK